MLGKNLRVPRAPQAQKGAAGDGVFMRLMALPKGRGMLTRALRVLYAPPSLSEAVPGARLPCSARQPASDLPVPRICAEDITEGSVLILPLTAESRDTHACCGHHRRLGQIVTREALHIPMRGHAGILNLIR